MNIFVNISVTLRSSVADNNLPSRKYACSPMRPSLRSAQCVDAQLAIISEIPSQGRLPYSKDFSEHRLEVSLLSDVSRMSAEPVLRLREYSSASASAVSASRDCRKIFSVIKGLTGSRAPPEGVGLGKPSLPKVLVNLSNVH